MAKNKLEKFGFTKAVFYLNPEANSEFDHPRVHLFPSSGYPMDGLWLMFQRHRIAGSAWVSDYRDGRYVMEYRETITRYPWQDVGRVAYSPTYGGRLRDTPMLDSENLRRLAKIVDALGERIDSMTAIHDAIVACNCPVEMNYQQNRNYVSDIDASQRGKMREWAWGADASRLVADMETQRAVDAERRAREG